MNINSWFTNWKFANLGFSSAAYFRQNFWYLSILEVDLVALGELKTSGLGNSENDPLFTVDKELACVDIYPPQLNLIWLRSWSSKPSASLTTLKMVLLEGRQGEPSSSSDVLMCLAWWNAVWECLLTPDHINSLVSDSFVGVLWTYKICNLICPEGKFLLCLFQDFIYPNHCKIDSQGWKIQYITSQNLIAQNLLFFLNTKIYNLLKIKTLDVNSKFWFA